YRDAVAVRRAAVDTAEADLRVATAMVRGVEAEARSRRWKLQHAGEGVENQIALLHARGDLLRQFQQNGQGYKTQAWTANGANKPVSPTELGRALGSEKIGWLVQEAGLSHEQLLAGLSRELPQTVDNLTSQGRVPTEQEAAHLV